MPVFGKVSTERLVQAHPDLQRLLNEAIKHIDFSVVCTYRGREDQEAACASGASTKHWPDSKHNSLPAIAADLCPYRGGLQWKDREAFYFLGGFLKGLASGMGIKIRWGGDWDGDNDFHDQNLYDLPHIELVNP